MDAISKNLVFESTFENCDRIKSYGTTNQNGSAHALASRKKFIELETINM